MSKANLSRARLRLIVLLACAASPLVNKALRTEAAERARLESERELPRGERRKRQKAVRDLSQLFVSAQIDAGPAMQYAECLVGRGLRTAADLDAVDEELLNACGVRKQHRRRLIAARETLSASLRPAPAAASVEGPAATEGGSSTAAAAAAAEVAEAVYAVGVEGTDGEAAEETHTLRVGAEQAGARLDAVLAAALPPLSRSYFSELCALGLVRVGSGAAAGAAAAQGAPAKKSLRVKEGDTITVRLRAAAELAIAPEPLPLSILYEDGHVVAVDKAAGMVVHPAPGHWNGTLINALLHRYQSPQADAAEPPAAAAAPSAAAAAPSAATQLPDLFGDGLRPGLVHRLDRYTTGVLLAARSLRAQQALVSAFAERRVWKCYVAVCAGVPPPRTEVTERVGRHPTDRQRMAVAGAGQGREARSIVHLLGHDGRRAVVAVLIRTGRTHQIRVHMQHLRHPLLGDPTYGDANWNRLEARRAPRPMLHAFQVQLAHPTRAGERLRVTAPPPDDFTALASAVVACEPTQGALGAWLEERVQRELGHTLEDFEF